MTSSRNKLYFLLIIVCSAGYIWLYYSIKNNFIGDKSVEVCIVKNVTNIPCPSCGSTRSLISVLRGDFFDALLINPIGFILAIIMFLSPLWISVDFLLRRKTLFDFYQKIEIYIRKPQYAIPLILLVLINWIWNITKGL
jgi:hypothetical protein